jgi:transcriptional regulator GlxA family with amidase domain
MNNVKEGKISHHAKKHVVIVTISANMLVVFAGPTDVFTNANMILQNLGIEGGYDVQVVAATIDKKVVTNTGMSIVCDHSVMEIDKPIDTLIITGNSTSGSDQPVLNDFFDWLSGRGQHNTRRIASVCGGAFALAKVGLLNGHKATTHWQYAEKLNKEYPSVQVNCDPMFTQDGHIFTAGGGSSGIDLALAMVEQDYGKEIANRAAKRLVFYLNRPGYQTQFGNLVPAYKEEHIAQRTQNWISKHLQEKLDINQVADQMNMSSRNFTRVFTKQTGISPAKFIERIRVNAALKYLEDTDISIERISEKCGLGDLVNMRRTFLRHLNLNPSDYRRSFRTTLSTTGTNPYTLRPTGLDN